MRPLCIYHGNCFDGFGAAWVVRKYFHGEVEMFEGVYGQPPPDCTGRDVYMVDFSYPRVQMDQIVKECGTLYVFDHHKTAEEALRGLELEARVVFDMGRSGVGITWDELFPDKAMPWLLRHIEDRDLWRFEYPKTKTVQAGLSSYPFDFEVWDRLISQGDNAINALSIEGNAIERKHWQDLRQILKVTKRYINLGGYRILCANVPFTMTSDAGNEMCKEHPTLFAACYWDTPDARVYSLRSLEGGIDVSEIATLYGGGGHKHAAGFQIPAEHFDFWDEA